MPDALALEPDPAPATTAAGHRLLAAADDLFYRHGIGAVGVDALAAAAGVTKRTLYQRFGSKNELVAAYLQRRAHAWQSQVLAELAEAPVAQRPLVVFDVAARWAGQSPRGCAFVNAWAELAETGEPTVGLIRAEKRWMRELFRQLVDDPALADHLHLLYEGAQVVASTLADPGAFTLARRTARDALG